MQAKRDVARPLHHLRGRVASERWFESDHDSRRASASMPWWAKLRQARMRPATAMSLAATTVFGEVERQEGRVGATPSAAWGRFTQAMRREAEMRGVEESDRPGPFARCARARRAARMASRCWTTATKPGRHVRVFQRSIPRQLRSACSRMVRAGGRPNGDRVRLPGAGAVRALPERVGDAAHERGRFPSCPKFIRGLRRRAAGHPPRPQLRNHHGRRRWPSWIARGRGLRARHERRRESPSLEMLIPSTVDDSLAPPGAHGRKPFLPALLATRCPRGAGWDEERANAPPTR
jgi:hypothetical protein